MNEATILHIPVMAAEAAERMPLPGRERVLVDCTIGYGSHSVILTQNFTEEDILIGIDRDEEAIAFCRKRFSKSSFPVRLFHRGYEELEEIFASEGIRDADGFLLDCGFSSAQVDRPERGFSFNHEGPLDMRMDRRSPVSARELIETWSEPDLTRIFMVYGEERFARKIAKGIVRRRQESPIVTTQELADVVLESIPAHYRYQEGIHPATRVFQAIRISINNELDCLSRGLETALKKLRPKGRVAVLSYHSLEHRIVKECFRQYCGRCICPPGLPQCGCGAKAQGTVVTKKPVTPCAAEREMNPRSRSAQLRVLERFQSAEE